MKALFYRNPTPLSATEHGERGIRSRLDFAFARRVNAVPIGVAEVALAALWYPVVFTAEDEPRLVAILGLRDNENLFVDRTGAWLRGAYVPAVVRRYPFILAESADALTLCIDDHPEVLVEREQGRALFAHGRPTALVDGALDFCRSVLAGDKATGPYVEALMRLGLLAERTADAVGADGRALTLNGFQVIDEAAFRDVRDGDFLDLRRRGWLQPIHAQLLSTLNWTRLAELDDARRT